MLAGQLILIVFCMAGHAFFAGIETGIISIRRVRLEHLVRQGSTNAAILHGFLENSDRLLGTTLVGTNLLLVVLSVISASVAVAWLGRWGESVSMVVISVTVLVFCEYLPKAWFHSRPIERCRRFAGMLLAAELLLKPIAAVIVWLTRWLVPGPKKSFARPTPFITREDLKVLAHEGEKNGALSRRERVMIHRVFELSRKRAQQIMTPRAQMVVVSGDTSISGFLETARASEFTRFPVYDEGRSEFVGTINVFDVLSSPPEDEAGVVADFIRPPLLIPETMPADDILPRLRRSRQPMALVGTGPSEVVGLVTTEDILEEIVGQL